MPSQVRAFFSSLLQVVLLTASVILLIFLLIRPDPEHYFAGSRLQLELLKTVPSPRIILIGGSNVAFGIDAEMMQQVLGIPVINDGLHAGLGIVPLRELQDYLHPGDIVIISLEYNMFVNKDVLEGDLAFLSDWIEYSPQRIKYLPDPWRQVPALYATMLQRKVNREVNRYLFGGSLDETRSVFVGTKYSPNGDFIGHLEAASLSRKKIPSIPYPVSNSLEDMFLFLEHFNQVAREKGASVYFEAPASRKTNCANTGETSMADFFKLFEERSSIPILTSLQKVCLPDKYFFDTFYHLNAQGRQVRTQRLIEDWLQRTASAK